MSEKNILVGEGGSVSEMMKMKAFLKKILFLFPTRNIICFESFPDCSGNTKAVFDEMIRRGYNSKYRMVWFLQTSEPEDHRKIPNVRYLKEGKSLYFMYWFAKLFISENSYFSKTRKTGQYAFHMFHGGALKKVTDYYRVPDEIDEVISLSPFLLDLDATNNGCRKEIMKPLGFPRNDVLLGEKRDFHNLFRDYGFRKIIYWMPTYRQHRTYNRLSHSSISMPVIHDEEAAGRINDAAKEHDVLLVVKPHPSQDVSLIRKMKMSNLVFIDDAFLAQNGVLNYELLGGSDALITDYSSVYYDFLLTNRPIGLCWEDFDEYREKEGFIVDTGLIMSGGEKIYTTEDLCEFVGRIGTGTDLLKEERNRIRNLVFPEPDKPCTGRVVDRIDEILKEL